MAEGELLAGDQSNGHKHIEEIGGEPYALVYWTRFDEPLPSQVWQNFMQQVPEILWEKIERYFQWQDRHRSLFGKLLLKALIDDLGLEATSLENLGYTPYHRPSIPGKVDFNLSHAGNYVVCAGSRFSRVGIDIEQIKQVNLDNFSLVLTPAQTAFIKDSQEPLREFFRLWTLKESVIKANGKGLTIPLNQLETDYQSVEVEGFTWNVKEFHLDSAHPGHFASELPRMHLEFKELNFYQK